MENELFSEAERAIQRRFTGIDASPITSFIQLLKDLTEKRISEDVARERITSDQELLRILVGLSGDSLKSQTGQSLIDFGEGNSFGNISINKVVGGDNIEVNRLSINLRLPFQLTWAKLEEFCRKQTEVFYRAAGEKYSRELYLPRTKVFEDFKEFLDSQLSGFVLLGKAGVGKSSFFQALSDIELGVYRPQLSTNVYTILYDCANAGIETRRDIGEFLYDELREYLPGVKEQNASHDDALERHSPNRDDNIWEILWRVPGIEGKKIVFGFDAINENRNAQKIMRLIDELVGKGAIYPWIKVVVSSRPESWRDITRGVKLREGLYYQIEMKGFDHINRSGSAQMEDFQRDELPRVYAKYQQQYKIHTPYELLSDRIRDVLQDPFNLNLVAVTYANKHLPNHLKLTDIVKDYIDALGSDDFFRQAIHIALKKEDTMWLENTVIPLMLQPGIYPNKISRKWLREEHYEIYKLIFEHSDEFLQTDNEYRPHRLFNSGILIRRQVERDEEIAFKYERFYEYFVGNGLLNKIASCPVEEQVKQYRQLGQDVIKIPYLWGAVKHCLISHMKHVVASSVPEQSRKPRLLFWRMQQKQAAHVQIGVTRIVTMCVRVTRQGAEQQGEGDDERMGEILNVALVEYGQDDKETVKAIVTAMLAHS